MNQESPEQILGIESGGTLEQIEIAYRHRLSEIAELRTIAALSKADQDELERDQERILWAYRQLCTEARRNPARADGIISAELFPVLDPFELPRNVVPMARRTGASATPNGDPPAGPRPTPELAPLVNRDSSLNIIESTSSDLEALLQMPARAEASHRHILTDEDDESVLVAPDSLGLPEPRPKHRGPPLRIRSVIGDRDKDVVGVRTPNSSSAGGKQKTLEILAQMREPNGAILIQLREALGVSIQELATRTKIHPRHIQALEHDELNALPAPVYYRGFVVSYLRYLGIENLGLVNAFVERYQSQRQTIAQRRARG